MGDPGTVGDLLERKAFAQYKSALQADGINELLEKAGAAAGTYSDARTALKESGDREDAAKAGRCEAMLALIGFHGSKDGDERRNHARESWTLAKEALEGFEEAGSPHEFRRTFNDLALSAVAYTELLPDYQTRKGVFDEAIDAGEKAARRGHEEGDVRERVKTLVMVSSLLERAGICGVTRQDFHSCHEKALEYWKEAETLSREDVLAELPFAAFVGDAPVDPDRNMESEFKTFLEALDIVRRSRDRFMIGHVLIGISFYAHWVGASKENMDELTSLMKEALDYIVDAGDELSKIGFVSSKGANFWHMAPHWSYHVHLTILLKDPRLIREHARMALEHAPEAEQCARRSGYTYWIGACEMATGGCMAMLADTETDIVKKRSSLEEAVRLVKHSLATLEPFDPENNYNMSIWHLTLAECQGRLAEAAADVPSRIRELEDAIESHKAALTEHAEGLERIYAGNDPSGLMDQGDSRAILGARYMRLFELTGNVDTLRKALECFEDSAEIFSKAGAPSRAAESHWEAAKLHDQLEDRERASERFTSASTGYKAAAEKIPRLKNLYSEYATYMDAWAEFERAKHHHVRQEYQQAQGHFENAARLCESLPKWRFLASNYGAWALLDQGEVASREERSKEAAEAFREAANLFQKADKAMEKAGKGTENVDEKRMTERLHTASAARNRYCRARAAIEKARELDIEGKHSSACEMYRGAADEFDKLVGTASSEQDKKEMKLVATISRAWERMNMAEAEFSPEPYGEAARLFEEAKDLSEDAKMKALALGHSRFCRALEAGVRFTDTRDQDLHAAATKNLESASSYYLKAGSDTCAEYARASKLLFDAYAFLDDASQEKDHQKAAKGYSAADKVLQASAESFGKAGQQTKKEQVSKLLEKVRQDRELAVSLMQVLEAPSGVSSTAAFSAPTPTQETAAGLDRFMHADIQATVMGRPKNLHVGDNLNLEIELVNAGRGSAQLTKVERIIPNGFEVCEIPLGYRVEDSCLSMKGRRLDPLKTEDVRIVLRPTAHGSFRLNPRIMYLDDSGKYRSHEPEPVDITVRELGIGGWLKGPEKKG